MRHPPALGTKGIVHSILETGPAHTASICILRVHLSELCSRLTTWTSTPSPRKMLVAQPTPDAAHWRPHCTQLVPHPLFPHGAKHFLHPCGAPPAGRRRCYTGGGGGVYPSPLRAPQSQTNSGDPTGRAVWRGASVMAARILKHEGKSQRRGVAIELGCGAAAIPATAAAWCGFETCTRRIFQKWSPPRPKRRGPRFVMVASLVRCERLH